MKLVKAWGSTSIGTSRVSLSKEIIKNLGDVVSWGLYTDLTTVHAVATDVYEDAGTPAGSWLGSNVQKLIANLTIKDNQNADVFTAKRNEIYILSYLLSTIEADEMVFNKGGVRKPSVNSSAVTNQTQTFWVPQRIALKDLPASVEIELGVLADYFESTTGNSATLNQIEFYVRYAVAAKDSFTERAKVFPVASFSSDTDIAHLIPEGIEILRVGFMAGDISAQTEQSYNNANITSITFKRGSSDEIDQIRRAVLDEFNERLIPNLNEDGTTIALTAPLGLTVIPSLSFVKTTATEFQFRLSGAIAPSVFYIYK